MKKEADKIIKKSKQQGMNAKGRSEVVSFFIKSNSECKKYIFSELIKLEQDMKNKRENINNLIILIDELIDKKIEKYLGKKNDEENDEEKEKEREDFIEFVKIGKSHAQMCFKKLDLSTFKKQQEEITLSKEDIDSLKDEINEIATEQFRVEIKGKSDKCIIKLINEQNYDLVIKNTKEDFGFEIGSELDTIVKMMRLSNKISQNKENRKENINELIDIINNFLEKNSNDDLKKYSDIKVYLDKNLKNIRHLFVDENGKIDIENINNFIKKIEQFDDYKNYFKDIIYAKLHEDILRNKNELMKDKLKKLNKSNNNELSKELVENWLSELKNNHFDNFFKDEFLPPKDKMPIMLHMLKTIITGISSEDRENFEKFKGCKEKEESDKLVDKLGYILIKNNVFDNFIDVFEKLGSNEFKSIFEQYTEFSGYNLSQFSSVFVELIIYCDENGKVKAGEKIFEVLESIFVTDMKINEKFSGIADYKKIFNGLYKDILINILSQLLNGKYELKNNKIIESFEKIVIETGKKIIENSVENTSVTEHQEKVIIAYLEYLNKQGMLKDEKENILKKIKNKTFRNFINKKIQDIEKKNEVIVNKGKSEGNEKTKIQRTDFVEKNKKNTSDRSKDEIGEVLNEGKEKKR